MCGWASQAKQNGLIDEIGGLDRALELVKERAKIPASERISLVTFPPRKTLFDYLLNRDDDNVGMETMLADRLINKKIQRASWQASCAIAGAGGRYASDAVCD